MTSDAPGTRCHAAYRELIGSLMYAAISTRPEIMYPVQALSQHLVDPGETHWIAAKRVLRYLKGTMNSTLTYSWSDKARVAPLGHSDTDWGPNVDDRRSVSGYVYTLAGGAIAWSAKKQPTVATSSVEAEYIADGHATKQALWLQSLLGELNFPQTDATFIKSDNVGAISRTNDPTFHTRTKHIDVQHHFI
jgi:hypothetical protein